MKYHELALKLRQHGLVSNCEPLQIIPCKWGKIPKS